MLDWHPLWAAEHSVETSAPPEAVWHAWSDVERRPEWNAGVERIDTGSTPPAAEICRGAAMSFRSVAGPGR